MCVCVCVLNKLLFSSHHISLFVNMFSFFFFTSSSPHIHTYINTSAVKWRYTSLMRLSTPDEYLTTDTVHSTREVTKFKYELPLMDYLPCLLFASGPLIVSGRGENKGLFTNCLGRGYIRTSAL